MSTYRSRGPFGRVIEEVCAVVKLDGTVAATFAGPDRVPNAVRYVEDEQRRAAKFGWDDPALRVVTMPGTVKRGDKVIDEIKAN